MFSLAFPSRVQEHRLKKKKASQATSGLTSFYLGGFMPQWLSRSLPVWQFFVLISQCENALCLLLSANKAVRRSTFKMSLLNFILWYLYNQNTNSVNSIIFLHKMFLPQGQISGRKHGIVPQVPQGQLATSISRSQTPAFLKSWSRFKKRRLEVINILLAYCGFENLEMSSFSLRPSWICEPSYWWVMRSFTLDYTTSVCAI